MNKTPLPSEGLQSVSYSNIAGPKIRVADLKKNFERRDSAVQGIQTDYENGRPGIAPHFQGSPDVCLQASNLTPLSTTSLTWKVERTVSALSGGEPGTR